MPEAAYTTVIERGYTAANDSIIDFLLPRIHGRWLDIGCNTGWLLSEAPRGVGVDASVDLVQKARAKGMDARHATAEALPFNAGEFEMAVLSCVLEQCPDWRAVLREAERVAARVIGINPIPGASPWGHVRGWVKSVIPEVEMEDLGCWTERMDLQRYYFEK